jgi:L-2,4-diaminobutyrate decarboxylase
LNPDDDALGRRQNLVWKSLQTTRRFDALKVFVSLRALGRRGLETMLDELIDLVRATARAVQCSEHLKLIAWPRTITLLLRWDPSTLGATARQLEAVNRTIPERLWESRRAVIGRTTYRGQTALRLTVLTPTTESQLCDVLAEISECGREIYEELSVDWVPHSRAEGRSR